MANSTIYIRAGNGEKGLQLCDSVSRLSSLASARDWQPCKVLWEMWWTRRCWKSTSKSMGTLMIFGCHGRQLCCCLFRGDVTYVTIHTSVQLFQLNCTISSFSHDLSWVIKTFMKRGLVKATDLRPFGFVTFKDSAAAQHFVDWSPHKVPDATVEIIAKWKHRHSAIQFHQKLDETSHTDSLQLQKKQNFPRQVGSFSFVAPESANLHRKSTWTEDREVIQWRFSWDPWTAKHWRSRCVFQDPRSLWFVPACVLFSSFFKCFSIF